MEASERPGLMTITWATRRIDYLLQIEPRRDLLITVFPDLSVRIRAPDSRPIEHILQRVHARRSWIVRQLRQFERLPSLPPPRFLSGETVLYLGREYRLRIEQTGNGVSLHGGRLQVRGVCRTNINNVREAVRGWLRERADRVFRLRVAKLQREIGILKALTPDVRVRQMKRRWGSCSARGVITMNPVLIQAPVACVDYVLVHELLHLLEPAHSPRFYELLGRAMGDWQARKERLARAAFRWY